MWPRNAVAAALQHSSQPASTMQPAPRRRPGQDGAGFVLRCSIDKAILLQNGSTFQYHSSRTAASLPRRMVLIDQVDGVWKEVRTGGLWIRRCSFPMSSLRCLDAA